MFRMPVVVLALLALAGVAKAQVRETEGPEAMQWVNPLGDLLPWLSQPRIEQELEILDDQKGALRKLRDEMHGRVQKLQPFGHGDDPNADRHEARRRYNAAAREIAEETDSRLKEILLPQQTRRIRQIAFQMKMASTGYGSASALTGGDLVKTLDITEGQRARLKEKEKEVAKEVQEKTREFFAKLQADARERLLEELTPAQRAKLEELTGEPFDWHAPAGDKRRDERKAK